MLLLGLVTALGVMGGQMARLFKFPSVTGYIITGLFLGPSLLGLVTDPVLDDITPITDFALGLIGFSLGSELKWRFFRENWENFSLLFLGESLLTFLLVFLPTLLFSRNLALAIMLGILATASAPASVLSTLGEKNARGTFPRILTSMVALDSLFCIIIFSVMTILLKVYYFGVGQNPVIWQYLGYELGLALLVGFLMGSTSIWILNNVDQERRRQVLLVAIILIAVGIPRQLNISYLLVTLIAGIMIVNLTPHYRKFFHSLHSIDTPVLVLFLTLAGARLELAALPQVGLLGLIYIAARMLGKILGSQLGASACRYLPGSCARIDPATRRYLGLALTPQAGVAVGLALLAEQELPLPDDVLVTVILGAIIFFQIIGPFLLDIALRKTDSI